MGQRAILKNLIVYFTFTIKNLTPTKLIKLIYLADLYHYKKYHYTISKIPFFSYHYGPWHPDIEKTVLEECGELIEVESVHTRRGDIIKIHKPKVKRTSIEFPQKEIFETLDLIVKEWGKVSTKKIIEYIKSTTPFIETRKGDPIDFMLIDTEFRESIEKASKQVKEGKFELKSMNEL
jgi:uncharacterized phage-associated protein